MGMGQRVPFLNAEKEWSDLPKGIVLGTEVQHVLYL